MNGRFKINFRYTSHKYILIIFSLLIKNNVIGNIFLNMKLIRKEASFEDGIINYYDKGTGPAIIFLHGYLESSEVWFDFMDSFPTTFRTLAIDLPGHGKSGIFGDEHSMEFMAEAVRKVMDNEGIEKGMITGHSMGGYVALAFLGKYPSRLHAYCLFHSHPFADTEEIIENRKREIKVVESGKKDVIYPVNVPRMFADFNTGIFEKELERHKEIASNISESGIIAVLKGMIKRPSRLLLLEKSEVPLLFILGRHDNYIPFEQIKEGLTLPPGSELVVLEKSGHLGFIEEKEKSTEAIINYFERLINN